MADRNWTLPSGSLDKGLVWVFAVVNVGAAGATTLQQWNPGSRTYSAAPAAGFRGVKSVTRTATGLWTVLLQNPYQRVMQVAITPQLAGGLAVCTDVAVNLTGTNVNSNTAPTLNLALLSATVTAADPASGEQILLAMSFQNSTAL